MHNITAPSDMRRKYLLLHGTLSEQNVNMTRTRNVYSFESGNVMESGAQFYLLIGIDDYVECL